MQGTEPTKERKATGSRLSLSPHRGWAQIHLSRRACTHTPAGIEGERRGGGRQRPFRARWCKPRAHALHARCGGKGGLQASFTSTGTRIWAGMPGDGFPASHNRLDYVRPSPRGPLGELEAPDAERWHGLILFLGGPLGRPVSSGPPHGCFRSGAWAAGVAFELGALRFGVASRAGQHAWGQGGIIGQRRGSRGWRCRV